MITFFVTLGWIALITLALGILAFCVCTILPIAIDFVKAFIKWNFR